jgi:amino acid transporter
MPFISMFAVANSALINKLMASRLVYGMARQRVVPPILGRVGEVRRTPWMAILFTTLLALGLVFWCPSPAPTRCVPWVAPPPLLLLGVFTVVNLAVVVVLRRDRPRTTTFVRRRHCRSSA